LNQVYSVLSVFIKTNTIIFDVSRAKMSDELAQLSQQIADLQEKMAYQEDGHAQLEKEIIAQQATLNKQNRLIAELFDRVKELRTDTGGQEGGQQEEPPPPHY
jgi:uncharacterized coiled-coil protein SlyX